MDCKRRHIRRVVCVLVRSAASALQQLDSFRIVRFPGAIERRVARAVFEAWISSPLQQQRHRTCPPHGRREHQRSRIRFPVPCIDFGPVIEENVDDVRIPCQRGVVKRSIAAAVEGLNTAPRSIRN